MNELVDMLAGAAGTLHGENGLLAAVICWMGVLRVIFKLFSQRLLESMEKALAFVIDTPSEDDDRFFQSVLESRAYRVTAFLTDYLFSIKLPTKLPEKKP